jgi:hypothetical protein
MTAIIILVLLEGMTIAGLLLFAFALVRSVALTNGLMLALLAALCIAAGFLAYTLRWAPAIMAGY